MLLHVRIEGKAPLNKSFNMTHYVYAAASPARRQVTHEYMVYRRRAMCVQQRNATQSNYFFLAIVSKKFFDLFFALIVSAFCF